MQDYFPFWSGKLPRDAGVHNGWFPRQKLEDENWSSYPFKKGQKLLNSVYDKVCTSDDLCLDSKVLLGP